MKCNYCKQEIEPGRGLIKVLADGKIIRLCSSKCRKNMSLGRKPINVKWITKKKKVSNK